MKTVENVGDLNNNRASQAFLSFDISGIPADATITQVKVDFSDFDMLDAPFSGLECLRAYPQDYGVLDSSDYHSGLALGAIGRWCDAGQLSTVEVNDDFKDELQAKLGDSRFQIRMHFNKVFSDTDGQADMVRLGDVKLIVTYID